MTWKKICDSSNLKNLPFKIETNQQGQVLMTPVKVYHSLFQGKIIGLLYAHLRGGEALAECAIHTESGTKVADVAWCSAQRLQQIQNETECSIAPEICIEVMSSANSEEEMAEKRILYFANGAEEVWICDPNGHFTFFLNPVDSGASLLAPKFPESL
ncbi:MAG: Uma2 family endonuclease [Desulfobacterales bacterium]|nr:Uma2 family endonuclease [Desulfobacterales bacterium]